jgi:hypothetical protein
VDSRDLYKYLTYGLTERVLHEVFNSYLPGRDDGPADAYRHVLLAAELTRIYGEYDARTLLQLHEVTGDFDLKDPQSPEARAMDEYNNELGVEIGKTANSWEEVVSRSRPLIRPDLGGATWLPESQWEMNPYDDDTPQEKDRIPNGDPRLKIPPDWPDGPYIGVPVSYEDRLPPFWMISPFVSRYWTLAGIILSLRDPLALDLNNDGITTISANSGIMFDHNNSGIRYGTGWINPNDGWLALDRNGNGKIDSGRELFGDNTRKLSGGLAAHAYDALKSFDTNNDGKVDAVDATGDVDGSGAIDGAETYWDIDNNQTYDANVDKTFADLRVWVDANSNGVTDGGELKTLAALNIVSIGTGKTAVNVADENGNLNTFKGNYTTSSGEVVDGARSFNLLQNTFHRDWPNSPNILPDVAALPNMQGSGAVRDLHEAMSLGTGGIAGVKKYRDRVCGCHHARRAIRFD